MSNIGDFFGGGGVGSPEWQYITKDLGTAGVYSAVDGDDLQVDTVDATAVVVAVAPHDTSWVDVAESTIAQPRITASSANMGTVSTTDVFTTTDSQSITISDYLATSASNEVFIGFADIAASASPAVASDIFYNISVRNNTSFVFVDGSSVYNHGAQAITAEVQLRLNGDVVFWMDEEIVHTATGRTTSLRPSVIILPINDWVETQLSARAEDGKTGYTIELPVTDIAAVNMVLIDDWSKDFDVFPMTIKGQSGDTVTGETELTLDTVTEARDFVSAIGSTDWAIADKAIVAAPEAIIPPKRSTEFPNRNLANAVYNTGAANSAVIDSTTQRGSYLPISDSSDDMISIRLSDPEAVTSIQTLVRKNIVTYSQVWSKTTIDGINHRSNFHYDVAGGKIWLVLGSNSVVTALVEINILTGAETSHAFSSSFNTQTDNDPFAATPNLYRLASGNFILLWVNVTAVTAIPEMQYQEFTATGTLVGAITTVQVNGTDAFFNGTYITKDNKTMCDSIYESTHKVGASNINIYRGGGIMNVTYSGATSEQLGSTNIVSSQQDTLMFATKIMVWGEDTVAIVADQTPVDPRVFQPVYGVRFFDRTDFDRWLNELADVYDMPLGVDLLNGLVQ
jgi:hypothetical protein